MRESGGGMREKSGCNLAANTDQARENSEYVRRMLVEKQPAFAALLESLEAELACPVCRAVSAGFEEREHR
jgi:hypothetical protein